MIVTHQALRAIAGAGAIVFVNFGQRPKACKWETISGCSDTRELVMT